MKTKICALFAVFLLAGCGGSSYQLKMPQAQGSSLPAKFDALNLPEKITLEGEIFTRKNANNQSVEYYLSNEQGFEWSKLVTIVFDPNVRDLSLYKKAVEHTHKTENTTSPRHYEVKQIDNKVVQKVLYMPIAGNANFDKYEANFIVANLQSCGLVSVLYAQNFDKNQSRASLIKMLNDDENRLLKAMPKIECR